jgi:glycosyltransferase involved in cell wall biosynthesis
VAETAITVVRSGLPLPAPAPGELVVSDDELRAWVLSGDVLRRIQRYDVARLVTERLATSGRPMLAWALRLLARRRCYVVDTAGGERDITTPLLLRWSWQLAREAVGREALLRRVEHDIDALAAAASHPAAPRWDRTATPVFLRTDLSFGVRAGGSVGHIAGVVNELEHELARPVLLTTSPVPTVRADIEVHHVHVPERFWNFRELPTFVLNAVFVDEAKRLAAHRPIGLVYQRYSLNSYAGLRLARDLGVPFVLEYNGSEVWMSRHWGRPLKYESLAERIERLNVDHADLVVVVSRAMRDELVARGVSADRILVNPNGVDPERYRPDIDGSAVRRRYGLEGMFVLGFISTFQPWHGAQVLARAFVILLRDHPEYAQRVRLLMIGTGPLRAETEQIIQAAGLAGLVPFTGLVAQEDGPQHLAGCDVLVSPHVPNADGTPFFGSPTKLFEYMAMGKGIVASDLDQIGEVLRHRDTAWLVPPDDPEALARGLAALIDDAGLRQALGAAARRDALAHHTWRAHVRRTIDALESRLRAHVA